MEDQIWTLLIAGSFAAAVGGAYLRHQRLKAAQGSNVTLTPTGARGTVDTVEDDPTPAPVDELEWRHATPADLLALENRRGWDLAGTWQAYRDGEEVTVVGIRLRDGDGQRYLVGGPLAGHLEDRAAVEEWAAAWRIAHLEGDHDTDAVFHVVDAPEDPEEHTALREALGWGYRAWVDGDGPKVAPTADAE